MPHRYAAIEPSVSHDAMTRDRDRHRVCRARLGDAAHGLRRADAPGEIRIRDRGAGSYRADVSCAPSFDADDSRY